MPRSNFTENYSRHFVFPRKIHFRKMTKKFTFPDFYDHPPFWTKQRNADVLSKQVELWSSLICGFCKAHNLTEFEIQSSLDSPLFNNKKINRNLDKETLFYILDEMAKKGNAKFTSTERNRVRIYWRTIKEWADMLYTYGKNTGDDGPFTFYELYQGEMTINEPFYKMNPEIMKEAVLYLQEKKKAVLMNADKPIDQNAVKFL